MVDPQCCHDSCDDLQQCLLSGIPNLMSVACSVVQSSVLQRPEECERQLAALRLTGRKLKVRRLCSEIIGSLMTNQCEHGNLVLELSA